MAAELRLNVALDLQYFKRQLPKLSQAAAGFQLPIQIKFDRRTLQREIDNLKRSIKRKKITIEVSIAGGLDKKKFDEIQDRLNALSKREPVQIPVSIRAAASQRDITSTVAQLNRRLRGSNPLSNTRGKIAIPVTIRPAITQANVRDFKKEVQDKLSGIKVKVQAEAQVSQQGGFASTSAGAAGLFEYMRTQGLSGGGGAVGVGRSERLRKLLEDMNLKQLKNLAKEQGISGVSRLNKNPLIDRLVSDLSSDVAENLLGNIKNQMKSTGPRRIKRSFLDQIARAVMYMAGIDPEVLRQQAAARRLPPAVNFPTSVPPRNISIGPSSTGRALPAGPSVAALPGTSRFAAKYLPTDLGAELKQILRGAAYAFVDAVSQRIRRVLVSEIGPARLSPARTAGLLPSAVGRPAAIYGGPGDTISRRIAQARARSNERSARIMAEGPQGFALGAGGSGAAGPFRPFAQPAPGGAIVPYQAPPRQAPPRTDLSGGYQGLGRLAAGLGKIDRNLQQTRLPLTGAIQDLGSEFGNAVKQVLLFGTAYKALAFVVDLPNQALAAATSLQTFRNQLEAVTGSAAAADQAFKFVDDLASRFNVPLDSARQGFVRLYASMAPAGFDPGQIEGLFTGISKAAATFGLSADKVDRVNYAFAQMASKGQIMSEELKGQLGDVLPGAVSLFAEAAQMSIPEFTKALEDGAFQGKAFSQVIDNVAILMNTKFAGAAAGASKTLQGRLNDLGNQTKRLYESFEPLVEIFAAQAFPALAGVVQDATSAVEAFGLTLDGVNPATNLMSGNAVSMYEAMVQLNSIAQSSATIIKSLGGSFAFLGSLIGTVTKLLSGILANPIGQWFVKLAFYISAATVALQLFAKSGLIAATRSLVMMVRQLFAGVGALKAFTASARAAKIAMGGFVAGAVLVGLEALVTHIANARNETDKLKQSALSTADALRQMSMSQLLAEKRGQEAVLRATKQLREGYGGRRAPTKEQTRLAGVAGLEVTGRAGQRRIDMSMVGAVEQQAERRLAEVRHAISRSGQGVGGGAPSLQTIDLSGGDSGGGTAGKGPQDITSNQLIVAEAINQKRREGNDLAVAHLEFAKELLDIQNSDLQANQKAERLDTARTNHAIKIKDLQDKRAKEQAQALAKEASARDELQRIMLDAQLAAGDITKEDYDAAMFARDKEKTLRRIKQLQEEGSISPEAAAATADAVSRAKPPEKLEGVAAWVKKTEEELKDFEGMATSAADSIASEFGTAFSGILQGTTSLQEGLGNAFKNIGSMFADMVMQMLAKWAMLQVMKGLFPGMAEGGVVSASGGGGLPSLVPGFANGGVVKGPTMAMVGEGRFNEAIVPLPNGKSIPVEMGGSAGGNISTNITVNVNNGQVSSKTSGSQGNDLARNLEGAVKQVIMREMQPGGMIRSGK
jgi:tape measure domain-containing protein